MTKRGALLAKVQALLQKTVANGCTEAEALAALAKAHELIAEYDITDAELAFGGETVERESKQAEDRDHIREGLVGGVAAFCQCRGWQQGLDTLAFCGLQSDVIFAHWLLDMLADFVRRALADYLAHTWRRGMPRIRRIDTDAFVIGCVNRLVERLHELAARRAAGTADAKRSLIVARMRELGVVLERQRGRWRRLDPAAHAAGRRHSQSSRRARRA